MKRLFEGASIASVVFYLIIVATGFVFGTKQQHDKAKHERKLRHQKEKIEEREKKAKAFQEKKHESEMKNRDTLNAQKLRELESKNREDIKFYMDKEVLDQEIINNYRKMNETGWTYFNEIEGRTLPIPGDIAKAPPKYPKMEWDDSGYPYYKFYDQEK